MSAPPHTRPHTNLRSTSGSTRCSRLRHAAAPPSPRSTSSPFPIAIANPGALAGRLRATVRTALISCAVGCWSTLLRLQTRLADARRGARTHDRAYGRTDQDRGSQTTDFLLIAGIVAATALAVGAIIGPKLIAKARSISLGG